MARHKRKRKICFMPVVTLVSTGHNESHEALTVEEYETIRLIDYIGCTQSEAAEYMQVARTTVQAIYFTARRKMAKLLVEGGELSIDGGEYTLCDGNCNLAECQHCDKKR